MKERNKLGQFVKGNSNKTGIINGLKTRFKKGQRSKNWNGFKKGQHISPKTEFKKGQPPWNKGKKYLQIVGKNHWNWKGGRWQRPDGHWHLWRPNHPFADKDDYVRHSRLTVEKIIGRYLTRKEVVHHINGDSSNDKPKNLYLFPSNSEHRSYEGLKNKPILQSNLL